MFVIIFVTFCTLITADGAVQKRSNYCPPNTRCVPFASCSILNQVMDERCLDDNRIRRLGCDYRHVCCPTTQHTATERIGTRYTNRHVDSSNAENVKLVDGHRCGVSMIQSDDSYHGLGAYPWAARIGFINVRTREVKYPCTGSIIQNRVILTATHCAMAKYENYKLYNVRVGEFNINHDIDCNDEFCAHPVQDIGISHIIKHSDYDNATFSDTIALLILKEPMNYTVTAQPICLPEPWSVTHTDGLLIGWGKSSGQRTTQIHQQALRLPIQPIDKCVEIYGRTLRITSDQICAGGEIGNDACAGFAGAPLVTRHSDVYYQVGILSFGVRDQCGAPGIPSVYTNIKSYVHWIRENIPTYS